MPNIESLLDAVDGAEFITVADVQCALHQLPAANSDIEINRVCLERKASSVSNAYAFRRFVTHLGHANV